MRGYQSGGGEWVKWGKGSKTQTSSYKIDESKDVCTAW